VATIPSSKGALLVSALPFGEVVDEGCVGCIRIEALAAGMSAAIGRRPPVGWEFDALLIVGPRGSLDGYILGY